MTKKLPKDDPKALAKALKKGQGEEADLSGAALGGVIVEDADFSDADLSGLQASRTKFLTCEALITDWSGADLRDAWFVNVSLRMATIADTLVAGTTFVACRLEQAHLKGSFQGATFIDCDFRDADLSEADLAGAKFSRVLASKKTKWPRAGVPAKIVLDEKAWMKEPGAPFDDWIEELKKRDSIDVSSWL